MVNHLKPTDQWWLAGQYPPRPQFSQMQFGMTPHGLRVRKRNAYQVGNLLLLRGNVEEVSLHPKTHPEAQAPAVRPRPAFSQAFSLSLDTRRLGIDPSKVVGCDPRMSILRGFIASGISRVSSIERSPSFISAPVTLM